MPAAILIPLPDEVSFDVAVMIFCGTGTDGKLWRFDLSGPDMIAIFGQAPVGLNTTQLSKAIGARAIAVDITEP